MAALPNDTFQIPVAGLANNKALGIQRGRLLLKAKDLQIIFEPVILQIVQLVQDQIKSSRVSVRAVLLVGGFGSSTYLRERLRNALGSDIQVMQPPNAWLAVVNGAVMKGLALSAPGQFTQVRIENRVARRHYGTEWALRYDDKEHAALKYDRWWCGLDGCFKVNTMNWFIEKVSNAASLIRAFHATHFPSQ